MRNRCAPSPGRFSENLTCRSRKHRTGEPKKSSEAISTSLSLKVLGEDAGHCGLLKDRPHPPPLKNKMKGRHLVVLPLELHLNLQDERGREVPPRTTKVLLQSASRSPPLALGIMIIRRAAAATTSPLHANTNSAPSPSHLPAPTPRIQAEERTRSRTM